MVFISYSTKDEDLVLPLVKLIRASGQDVFVDVQNLNYGADWRGQIAEAIRKSERFLVFWSSSSQSSQYVKEEWELALSTPSCTIVPIALDQTPLPTELDRFHGARELIPMFDALTKAKKHRRFLWISWIAIASTLAIFFMPLWMVMGIWDLTFATILFIDDLAFSTVSFIMGFTSWLILLLLPFAILLLRSLRHSKSNYRQIVKRLIA